MLTLPVAAALARALVVIPLAFAAGPVASSVPAVTPAPEALLGTAGLYGEAIDHAGRLAVQELCDAVRVAEEGVVLVGVPELLLLLMLRLARKVQEAGLPVVLPLVLGTHGAAAVLKV